MALFVLLLVPEFFAPLRVFAAAYQDRLHATGAAESLIDLPPLPEPAPPREVRTVEARGVTVAFDNVSLTWDPARGPALDGLSFRAPAGEMLVLAGPSGAGKSTVIEILLGFVRPDGGKVTINGADITDLVPQALSRLTAWIGQRPVLFAGTIRDNIRFARPEASDEEIEEAARNARVAEFAAKLPDGLDTKVGEGGYGLSGGQAQRVAIARAFLKNAPLLLLDEPTSHLDPATEAEVLESLRRLALGRTVILASHSAAAHAFGGRRLDIREGRAMVPGAGCGVRGSARSDALSPSPVGWAATWTRMGEGSFVPIVLAGRPAPSPPPVPLPPGEGDCPVSSSSFAPHDRSPPHPFALAQPHRLAGVRPAHLPGRAGRRRRADGAVRPHDRHRGGAGRGRWSPRRWTRFGITRVLGRYFERLVTHAATFRALADLRVWFFRHLARTGAGGLGFRQAGDVLARLVGDVEALDGLYLRILIPLAGALLLLPAIVVLIGVHDPARGHRGRRAVRHRRAGSAPWSPPAAPTPRARSSRKPPAACASPRWTR